MSNRQWHVRRIDHPGSFWWLLAWSFWKNRQFWWWERSSALFFCVNRTYPVSSIFREEADEMELQPTKTSTIRRSSANDDEKGMTSIRWQHQSSLVTYRLHRRLWNVISVLLWLYCRCFFNFVMIFGRSKQGLGRLGFSLLRSRGEV